MSTGYVHERNKQSMTKVTNIQKAIMAKIARIRLGLQDRVHSKVAEATGLHVNTVRNVAKESDQNFSIVTIEKLEKYLFGAKA
jgi:hypothetical protein